VGSEREAVSNKQCVTVHCSLKKVLSVWAVDINQFYAAKAARAKSAKEFSYEDKTVFYFRLAEGSAGIEFGAGWVR
jgi:hypothetical protein